jgi:anhydro-N-acetylmuramic acid kinase
MAGTNSTLALGLASRPLFKGIDLAALAAEGDTITGRYAPFHVAYPASLQAALWASAQRPQQALDDALGGQVTRLHADAARFYLQQTHACAVDIIGMEGVCLLHEPHRQRSVHLGDGTMLAQMRGTPVYWDMTQYDLARGGQGGPLCGPYVQALMQHAGKHDAQVLLFFGEVTTLVWTAAGAELIAMHCGPGATLLDAWARENGQDPGRILRSSQARDGVVTAMADNPYFDAPPPKALGAFDFDTSALRGLDYADGQTTLLAFIAECVWMAQAHLPQAAARWWLSCDSMYETALVEALQVRLGQLPQSLETLGVDASAGRAEAIAFMALQAHDEIKADPRNGGASRLARVSLP